MRRIEEGSTVNEAGIEVTKVQDPRETVDYVYTGMIGIAKNGKDTANSVILKSRHWILRIEQVRENSKDLVTELDPPKIDPQLREEDMFSEENAVSYASRLRKHLLEMMDKEGTDLPKEALEITGVFIDWVDKYRTNTQNGAQENH